MPREHPAAHCRSLLPLNGRFSAAYLSEYGVLPLAIDAGTVSVACVEMPDADVLEHIGRSFAARPVTVPVQRAALEEAIQLATGHTPDSAELEEPTRILEVDPGPGQPTVVRVVDALLRDAVAVGASDVHLEASEEGLRVRRRVDGELVSLVPPPRAIQAAVVSRLKLLGELDIAEQRRPQDGHLRTRIEGVTIDVRVSTVPSIFGESLVLRLLDGRAVPQSLLELGFTDAAVGVLERWAACPSGLILTTGPTGSGKTTTLHRLLALRADGTDKVITVEDPVEFTVPGVTQVPVHEVAGVTFHSVLRSVLRQDPDVVMVGEMRDAETARIAVRAALTGHLVLSTLHTNDAASAIPRLRDLGVEDYLLAATLRGIVAQRLVRALCPDCRAPRRRPDAGPWQAVGCDHCRGTGYRGRVALFELLSVTDDVREAVGRGADSAEIVDLARKRGFRGLREDAEGRVAAGITSREEIQQVLGSNEA